MPKSADREPYSPKDKPNDGWKAHFYSHKNVIMATAPLHPYDNGQGITIREDLEVVFTEEILFKLGEPEALVVMENGNHHFTMMLRNNPAVSTYRDDMRMAYVMRVQLIAQWNRPGGLVPNQIGGMRITASALDETGQPPSNPRWTPEQLDALRNAAGVGLTERRERMDRERKALRDEMERIRYVDRDRAEDIVRQMRQQRDR